ncbi:MAG: FKBP-type peptidyl-prolyl cis-trans isomerase [Chitinophagales bacterium]
MKQLTFLLFALFIGFTACNNTGNGGGDTATKATTNNFTGQDKIDADLIAKFVKDNNLKTQQTPSGIHYIIETEGTGENPTIDDQVQVHYKGTLLDDTQFDSSYERGEPITFPLKGVVKGWQEGIPLLKKGGKGKLIIPSSLAYGERARPTIPANSILIFDVELLDIIKSVPPAEQLKIDTKKIEAYLTANKLEAEKTESGIHYIVTKKGTGKNPTIDNKVKVHYKGTLLDGTEFDSSYKRNKPAEFPLKGVVKGWQEGIPLLKEGGKGTLLIPSALAYGPQGRPSIPPNSVLIFEVELLNIVE